MATANDYTATFNRLLEDDIVELYEVRNRADSTILRMRTALRNMSEDRSPEENGELIRTIETATTTLRTQCSAIRRQLKTIQARRETRQKRVPQR